MSVKDPHSSNDAASAVAVAPLGGTKAEAVQRLQIGLSGLAAMILLVGLANVIQDRARETEESTVPQAAPMAEAAPPPQSDPLADAGVVPDLPADSQQSPSLDPALVPEQGSDSQTR